MPGTFPGVVWCGYECLVRSLVGADQRPARTRNRFPRRDLARPPAWARRPSSRSIGETASPRRPSRRSIAATAPSGRPSSRPIAQVTAPRTLDCVVRDDLPFPESGTHVVPADPRFPESGTYDERAATLCRPDRKRVVSAGFFWEGRSSCRRGPKISSLPPRFEEHLEHLEGRI